MTALRYVLPVVLGACIQGALMMTTPTFDSVFQPMRSTAQSGAIAQGRLHAARFSDWQTAEQLSFDRYGTTITRDTQGIFLIVDVDILDVQESIQLTATWQGRSGRQYVQTARADGAPSTLDTRQFHPGLDDQGRAVFELPRDEIEGGKLLIARKGPNILDSELALTPTTGMAVQHSKLLRLE
ncbi:hypothetical protein PT7_2654 [Pusillimonas sp. T7-7]|uniref:hypothetical protein n=1 Tax=Pusillimonas sp. (strain T7-7) TaxID=1007105 RepID=UPI0002084E2C|nr:hypothetical protein [Pusillimonas sp. T7-7]AEC21194.1 hypothetical protein PT7_2654 [Pusillimonas sp. T7-7]